MKRSVFFSAIFSLAGLAFSAPYNGSGTYNLGPGAGDDYATLGAFATAFNAGSMTGDTTVLITGSITEPTNVCLGAPTNGFALTIKPAPGTQPVLTFTQSTRNATTVTVWDGQIVFGPATFSSSAATDFKSMRVVIDGSNTVNGTTRDLTITNVAQQTEIRRIGIHMIGDLDNSVIKNCKVISATAGATDNIGISISRRYVAAGSDFIPDNVTIDNCLVDTGLGNLGIGVRANKTGSTTPPTGTAIVGFAVKNCDITASLRAISFDDNYGGLISGNTVRCKQTVASSTANAPEVIRHLVANGTTGWTLDVVNNKIIEVESMSGRGINAVILVGGGTTPNSGTTNIVNNFIAGYKCTNLAATLPTNFLYRAISFDAGTGEQAGTFNVYHNSINIPDEAGITSSFADNDLVAAVEANNSGANTFTATINMKNNIFRIGEDRMKVFQARSTFGGTLSSNNNMVYRAELPAAGSGIHFAELPLNTNYTDFAAWQSIQDSGSVIGDPTVAAGAGLGKWVSATDLHFDADPGSTYDVAPIAGIAADIDGDIRPNPTTVGADEYVASSRVTDWSVY